MPAATTDNLLVLPRIPRPDPASATFRPVARVVTAPTQIEGAGFPVRRPFPGPEPRGADPFLLLDHLGAIEYAPGEAVRVQADRDQDSRAPSLEVLLLGGRPIHEPTVFYGPFVMNTQEEIVQAIEDFRAGRMGTIPATYLERTRTMAGDVIQVTNNEAAHRYEASIDGALSLIQYERRGDRIVFLHTEVPEALEGRGIAGSLARTALEDARIRHLTVVPICPFVSGYIRRHPEYLSLVAPPYRERLRSAGPP